MIGIAESTGLVLARSVSRGGCLVPSASRRTRTEHMVLVASRRYARFVLETEPRVAATTLSPAAKFIA